MKLNLVPATQGTAWVKSGIRVFVRQPLALGGLFFLFVGMMSVLGIVPILGTLASLVLLPSITLGLLQATRMVEAGRFPMPLTLVTALIESADKRRQMIKLGAYYTLAFLICLGITMLIDGGLFAKFYLTGEGGDVETLQNANLQMAAVVGTLLYIPMALLFWHAPALVFWHGIAPGKAMFFSLTACWRNKAAVLVYFLTWGGVFIACAVVVSILGSLLGPAFIQVIYMPLVLVLAAMVTVSVYFSVRDSFADPLPDLPPLPPR